MEQKVKLETTSKEDYEKFLSIPKEELDQQIEDLCIERGGIISKEKITADHIREAVDYVYKNNPMQEDIGFRSEGGNLIYKAPEGPNGERGISFMQKDTPENRANFDRLFREESLRQIKKYDEVLEERRRKLVRKSIYSALDIPNPDESE